MSLKFLAYAKGAKMKSLDANEVLEWMEGFLRCFPSNSVKLLIKAFRKEIQRNDRIYVRELQESKES